MKKQTLVISLMLLGLGQASWAATTNAVPTTAPLPQKKSTAANGKVTQTTNATQNSNANDTAKLNSTATEPASDAASTQSPLVFQQQRLRIFNQATDTPEGKYGFPPYLRVGGLVNVDTSFWTHPYFGQKISESSRQTYLDLSTAELTLDSQLGDWISAHASGLYINGGSPNARNAYPAKDVNRQGNLDDAYVTISNFNSTPFFVRGGEQYLPFGVYDRFPITQTLTQTLTETELPSAQVGAVMQNGLFASIFGADGEHQVGHSNGAVNSYGLNLGYQNYNNPTGYDAGVSYISNMANVNSIRAIAEDNHGYTRQVGGFSAFGDIYAGPFGASVRYIEATREFSTNDYAYTTHTGSLRGATPTATDLDATYRFLSFQHHSQVKIGYEWSQEAHNTASIVSVTDPTRLPKARWLVGYDVNIVKDLMVGLQYDRDGDYPRNHGGTGLIDNVLIARLSLMF